MALAKADLSKLGRVSFSARYWREAFSDNERKEYRRKARIVLTAINRKS